MFHVEKIVGLLLEDDELDIDSLTDPPSLESISDRLKRFGAKELTVRKIDKKHTVLTGKFEPVTYGTARRRLTRIGQFVCPYGGRLASSYPYAAFIGKSERESERSTSHTFCIMLVKGVHFT